RAHDAHQARAVDPHADRDPHPPPEARRQPHDDPLATGEPAARLREDLRAAHAIATTSVRRSRLVTRTETCGGEGPSAAAVAGGDAGSTAVAERIEAGGAEAGSGTDPAGAGAGADGAGSDGAGDVGVEPSLVVVATRPAHGSLVACAVPCSTAAIASTNATPVGFSVASAFAIPKKSFGSEASTSGVNHVCAMKRATSHEEPGSPATSVAMRVARTSSGSGGVAQPVSVISIGRASAPCWSSQSRSASMREPVLRNVVP